MSEQLKTLSCICQTLFKTFCKRFASAGLRAVYSVFGVETVQGKDRMRVGVFRLAIRLLGFRFCSVNDFVEAFHFGVCFANEVCNGVFGYDPSTY